MVPAGQQEAAALAVREEPSPTCLQVTYSNNTDPAKAPEPLEGLLKHHQVTNELDLIADKKSPQIRI